MPTVAAAVENTNPLIYERSGTGPWPRARRTSRFRQHRRARDLRFDSLHQWPGASPDARRIERSRASPGSGERPREHGGRGLHTHHSHCSMATLIGLSTKGKLLRSLPQRFKTDVHITPGTHASEHAMNKQFADKELVAAALQNTHLLEVVNQCLSARSWAWILLPAPHRAHGLVFLNHWQ